MTCPIVGGEDLQGLSKSSGKERLLYLPHEDAALSLYRQNERTLGGADASYDCTLRAFQSLAVGEVRQSMHVLPSASQRQGESRPPSCTACTSGDTSLGAGKERSSAELSGLPPGEIPSKKGLMPFQFPGPKRPKQLGPVHLHRAPSLYLLLFTICLISSASFQGILLLPPTFRNDSCPIPGTITTSPLLAILVAFSKAFLRSWIIS